MAIDASIIEDKDFKVVYLRGYSIGEVDDFLDEVATEVDRLQKENRELQAQVTAFQEKEKRLAEMEQTLRDTLITAQRAAEDVIRASREKAAAMLKDSELEGRRIVEDAGLRAEAAQQRYASINRDIAGVKALIRRVIGEQLRLLEEAYPEAGAAEPKPEVKPEPRPAAVQAQRPAPKPMPTLTDLDQTQEFSVREVREQALEEERAAGFKKTFNERLPQIGQNGDAEA